MTSQSLQALQEVAEALAAQYLDDYTKEIKSGAVHRLKDKEINDALWGTVSLSRVEVAVLDSPLLQRLRFLRQMGSAHWVYPGAVHTRFEHAIGTLYQTQQLIDALNAQARGNVRKDPDRAAGDAELITKEEAQLLRLSSLFSHVGHLAFSDSAVAELESHPEFETATKDFAADTSQMESGADPSFTQLLAHYIVKSPAVREFLAALEGAKALKIDGNDQAVESPVDYSIRIISQTIIGRRIDERRPQLQSLVTGPFDASTLDALVRDAKFAGIPSVLDIRRLVQKLTVKPFYAEDLPDWIGGTLLGVTQHETVRIFGIPSSATSVLNELQLAQLLVTTKIRRHPKVLATEQMLRSAIRMLGSLSLPKVLLQFLYTSAEDVLIGMSNDSLHKALRQNPKSRPSPKDAEKLILAADTLAAIRERRVWVRALQLSEAGHEHDSAESIGMNLLLAELNHVQRGTKFVSDLCTEVARVRSVTNQSAPSSATLAAQINLRILQPLSAEPRVGRAIVLPPDAQPHLLSDGWGVQDNWVSQYLRGQPTTYLFSPPDLADSVYLAFELLADKKFKAALPSGTIEASKRKSERIQKLKNLAKANRPDFWHGYSWSIRPKAEFWDFPHIHRRISDVAMKLSKVDTISAPGDGTDRRDATYRWLQQFETSDHIELALRMLEAFEIIDRAKTTSAFNALFAKHSEFLDAYAVSLGDPKDGGVIQGYFAADHPRVVRVLTLDQWLRAKEARPLIFVDDCCGTGSQGRDILAAWFDRKDMREPLEEDRDTLTQQARDKLLQTRIVFLFISAWNAGIKKIESAIKDLGLDAIVYADIPEAEIEFATDALKRPGKPPLDVEAFIERCTTIGTQLLQDKSKDPRKIEARSFGYGNRGMLMATLVNVPTQTATLIWERGIVDGTPWEPLLPRRKKT